MASRHDVIAVIDDDPITRTATEYLLSAYGYRTELFDSAEAFINAAGSSEAGCLLIDIYLKDITGIELARQLKANGLTWPIIFITGCTEAATRRQAMELGCVAYLVKPIPASRLIEAVKAAMASRPEAT